MSRTPPPPFVTEADASRLAAVYVAAEYRWARDGDWHDLRIGLPAPGLELLYPEVAGFGLLSAWNPWSQRRDEAANRREDEALAALLAARGFHHIPAFSSATNRSWREPGWLVLDIPVEELDELTRRFGQLGALWWPRGEAVRLRMHARRPAQAGHAAIDWLE